MVSHIGSKAQTWLFYLLSPTGYNWTISEELRASFASSVEANLLKKNQLKLLRNEHGWGFNFVDGLSLYKNNSTIFH